jgi:acetylornithine deacetylase/succinyl-diaminopimelate desuccinylase-like protein
MSNGSSTSAENSSTPACPIEVSCDSLQTSEADYINCILLGINSIEFGMDVLSEIQKRFYNDFPRTPEEDRYNYATCSTMKPCQISCTPGALNQLPPMCSIEGDIRLAPFYEIQDVKKAIETYVAAINAVMI